MTKISYAQLIIIGIVAGTAMIFGGLAIFNSLGFAPYANLAAVTMSLTMASVGALLFFSSIYSVVRDIFRIEEAKHESLERHGHEEHHKKE